MQFFLKMKKCIKFIDLYGVKLTFRYEKGDKYSTLLGGILTIIIFGVGSGFVIYYFIPFCNRKNFSLYYNVINLPNPDSIKLNDEVFGLRFQCDDNNYNGINVNELFDLEVKYFYKINGTKFSTKIDFSNCSDRIFRYNNNLDISEIKCLNGLNRTILNSFNDKIFGYYEIAVTSEDSYSSDYLLNNDCKLEFYYSDNNIKFSEYKKPINSFIKEIFLQLNPEIFSKMNIFYMNQKFESNDDLFLSFKEEPISKILFSRTEQYFIPKIKDTSHKNYKFYGKIYLRGDYKKVEIKRKYQNIMEFYSDTFSFWIALFYIIGFIIKPFYSFYADHFIEKKLFSFQETNVEKFQVTNKNKKKIEELIKKKDLKIETINKEDVFNINNNFKTKKIKYSFNFIEIIRMKICCNNHNYFSKNLSTKAKLSKIADEILDNKLDISYYLKSMLFLDIQQNLINDNQKSIYNFLSVPLISSKEPINQKELYKAILKGEKDNDIINLSFDSLNDNEDKLVSVYKQRCSEIIDIYNKTNK